MFFSLFGLGDQWPRYGWPTWVDNPWLPLELACVGGAEGHTVAEAQTLESAKLGAPRDCAVRLATPGKAAACGSCEEPPNAGGLARGDGLGLRGAAFG